MDGCDAEASRRAQRRWRTRRRHDARLSVPRRRRRAEMASALIMRASRRAFMSCRAMPSDWPGAIAEAGRAPPCARRSKDRVSKLRSRGCPASSPLSGGAAARDREQLAAEGEFLGAMTIAEKAVMADAMKAVRQGVQQKTPDELVGRQGHHLALVVMPVIAPAEADPIARHVDQPAVRDGDAVRVATEIGQDRRGAGEGALGVDDPLGAPQFAQAAGEDRCGGEIGERAEEGQPAGLERRLQAFPGTSRRNSRERTRTGRKKPGRQATQRLPSGDMPPPGTRQ